MKRIDFLTKPSKINKRRPYRMKKRRVRKDKFTKSVGKTWSGRWHDGTLGWGIGNFVSKYDTSMVGKQGGNWFWKNSLPEDKKIYLCKVTIEQVFDKNGKPIVRYRNKMKPR